MTSCINVKSVQYRELKRLSTLPEVLLKAEIAQYMDSHNGRFPMIDEIPGASSMDAIKQDLKIREDGTSKVEDILKFTGTSDLDAATVVINDKYRDLDTEIIPLSKTAIVDIKERPSLFKYVENPQNDFDFVDSAIFITQSLDKMAKTMGIDIKTMSIDRMREEGILKQIPDAAQASAFIYNGNIYVNSDLATVDSKIHELMHILLGSMRFKNPELYAKLIQTAEQLPNFEDIAMNYPNRSKSDLLEEVFVEEFSRYLAGSESDFAKLDSDTLYQISYNITRTLDSILMGDNTTAALDDETLYNSSLLEVGKLVNSSTMTNTRHGFIEDALVHRVMANVKQELFENGDLKEEC